jgi:DNA-binding NtrC family response regulator
MLHSNVLVISDDRSLTQSIRGLVESIGGLGFESLRGFVDARSYASWERIALVIVDFNGGQLIEEGLRWIRAITTERRALGTLVIADRLDPGQKSSLLKLGVADYLDRPVDRARLSRAVESLTANARGISAGPMGEPVDLAGSSDSADEDDPIMDVVRRVAPQSATILLRGETGTGKSRLAGRIHELSGRAEEPFVVVDCGSMSANHLEANLFGNVRGLFDSPRRDRPGKLAEVASGTLFLDDIDALPPTLQLRLLRAVEDRVLDRESWGKATPNRARLIAATNRELELDVEAGLFRSDLYHRINVIGLRLPPLRERRSAIPKLASKFLIESAAANPRVESIAEDAIRALVDYHWPGNIRELKNTIERAVLLATGPIIRIEDLPEAVVRPDLSTLKRTLFRLPIAPSGHDQGHAPNSTLAEIKRDAELARITEALQKHSNNRLRAASELGISRMTLYKKLYKYGLMTHGTAERRPSD